MTNVSRRPGPESTLDDVRSRLIEAGLGLVRERGVDLGFSDVSLSETILRAEVTRSTAYRSLAHDDLAPQAVLHRSILKALLSRYSQGETMSAVGDAIAAELERQQSNLTSDDVARRTHAMRGVIRVGANASYHGVISSPERSVLTATYGALQSTGQPDWRHEALAEGERKLTALFGELYDQLATLFGYRPKAPFTTLQFATAGASLIEGMAMRQGVNDHVTMIDRPTGENGADEPWSLFAIAFEAMFIGMFEPIDPDAPVADLAQY